MFELIRANKRKSAWLIAILGSVLIAAGYAAGFLLAPDEPAVAVLFVLVALVIWIVMLLTSMIGGEKILLKSAAARPIEKADAPQLYNVVEEMCIASGLSTVPKIYLIDSPDPNAFAVGLKPERAAVAVTTGLMAKLNRDELQNVVAHEIAHIQNRDTLFMTLAGVTVGAIIILGELLWRSMYLGGGRSRGGGGRGNNQGAAVMMAVAVLLAILAPILARLLYFACSRRREYLADACAAQYTRYPEGLASALDKISGQVATRTKKAHTGRTLAPMYIVNPLAARGRRAGWFSTHPPTEDRIRILRGMTANASLEAYEQAYRAAHGKGASVLVPSMLQQSKDQPVREASREDTPAGSRKSWREAQDMLHKIDRYALLACGCGMKLKIPPDFEDRQVACPKCGHNHPVPPELLMAVAAARQVSV